MNKKEKKKKKNDDDKKYSKINNIISLSTVLHVHML